MVVVEVVKPSDPHSPLVLGLRPMPKLIIAYEEDKGDHGSPKNCAKPRLAKVEVGEELLTDKCNLLKPLKKKYKYNK